MTPRNPLTSPRCWDYGYLFTRKLLADIESIFPRTGEVCVDVGSGTQPYAHLYREGRRIIGIDIDRLAPDLAVVGSADALPFKSSCCDIALILSCLTCVNSMDGTVREIARIVRPGGYVLISEHQAWQTYSSADRWHVTRNGFEYLGKQAGLFVEKILQQGSLWMRTGIAINRALLPTSASRWAFLRPLCAPIFVLNNLLFGIMDRVFPVEGEAVNHTVLYRKR